VRLSPSTYTYRLFVLLKSSAGRCVVITGTVSFPLFRSLRQLRSVSAVSFAASAEEANYTPGPHTRQHLLREKAGKFIAKPANRKQAHDLTEDMNKGYLSLPVKKRMPV
ncbi:hypothetical protein, partial [Chromobacterium piscinae]|uniref:hypothetical protein n=1 Tax=Chromobacterium piscinae TaxID=686831 RepID=UPI003261CC52